MVKRLSILFLTLVLVGSQSPAKPISPAPDADSSNNKQSQPSQGKLNKLDKMNVDTPSETKHLTMPKYKTIYYYPYQNSMSPRLGVVYDFKDKDNTQPGYLIGFYHMLPSISSRHIEIGADLFSMSLGRFSGGWRWVYNAHGKLRPFTKAALGVEFDGSEGLNSFLNPGNYQGILVSGFELLVFDPTSLRIEIEATVSRDRLMAIGSLGYSWAW